VGGGLVIQITPQVRIPVAIEAIDGRKSIDLQRSLGHIHINYQSGHFCEGSNSEAESRMINHLGLARFCIPFIAVGALHADAIYKYSGFDFTTESGTALYLSNPRWTTSENISITADFASAFAPNLTNDSLTPVSWSLAVGGETFTSSDGSTVLGVSTFTTDNLGHIVDWHFSIIAGRTLFPISTSGTTGDFAGVFGPDREGDASTTRIGKWSSAMAPVPEPGTLALLLPGLAMLFCWRCRQRPPSVRSIMR
jgi:hypothetical protein